MHKHEKIQELFNRTYEAASVAALIDEMKSFYGEFPIKFEPPADRQLSEGVPGIVITGLVAIPGAADRPEVPFMGAQVVGYAPALGHTREGGSFGLGMVKTAAFEANTVQVPREIDPEKAQITE